MKTLGERLTELGGIGPSFDHLRIGLATAILTWHSFSVSYGQDYVTTLPRFPIPILLTMLLPMFFALSGFLVMGSALRTGELKTFILFRVLRIVPALFTEILISALILGPLLTILPLKAYFTDPMFFDYFGSIIGRIRFSLPGLFLDNPAPQLVNFALWTVGPEIICYVALALLMLTGVYRSVKGMILIILLYAAIGMAADMAFPPHRLNDVLSSKLLVGCFLLGNLLFLLRDRVPFSRPLAIVAFLISMGLHYAAHNGGPPQLDYLGVIGLVYVVAVIGLSRLPPMPFLHRGDYSYGLYIYGFPIQQAIAHFLPDHRDWYINLAIALPITMAFAILSWHLIEKPVLGLKRRFIGRSARPPADPILPDTGFGPRKAAVALALSLYGLFVIDSSNIFPVRPTVKAGLSYLGLRSPAATDAYVPAKSSL